MNKVAELWTTWDSIISEYDGKPLPCFPSWENTNEPKADIIKRSREIAQIHFVLKNREKIEHMLFFLTTKFGFSVSELKASVSFYDALFALPESEAEWKVNYFLRLFGSHEIFLKAMRAGATLYPLEGRGKEFLGIMSYKRLEIFEEKLSSFSSELELPMECSASIFASQSWYMYCSAKTLKSQLEERCEFFSVPKGKIGQILISYPWFLACTKSFLEYNKQTLQYSFLLSEKEAKMVILKYPNILIDPHKTLLSTIAPERSAGIPAIIVQKPWLYTLYKVVRYCCGDYGYGSYETVLVL